MRSHPSAEIPGFVDKLLAALPSLHEHGCSYGCHGGFVRRLTEDRGTWMGHVLEHVAIEIQNLAGAAVTFGKTRSTGTEGEYNVVFEYEQEWVGNHAGDLALKLLHNIMPAELGDHDPAFDFQTEMENLFAVQSVELLVHQRPHWCVRLSSEVFPGSASINTHWCSLDTVDCKNVSKQPLPLKHGISG